MLALGTWGRQVKVKELGSESSCRETREWLDHLQDTFPTLMLECEVSEVQGTWEVEHLLRAEN